MLWSELKERVDSAIKQSGLKAEDVKIEYIDVSDRRLRQQELLITVDDQELLVWTK